MARRTPTRDAPPRSRKSIARTIAYSTATGEVGDTAAEATPPEPEAMPAEPEAKPAEPEAKPAEAEVKPPPKSISDAKPAPPPVEKPAPPAPAPPAPAPPAPLAPAPAPPADSLGPIYEPLPKPKEIVHDDPDAAAPPPGLVPRGDSRSFRRGAGAGEEFVLIYRFQTFVISRSGVVGKRGRWKVVEYPTMGAASHAYAQECSRLATLGYTDFRG